MLQKVLIGLGLALCLEIAPVFAQPANDPAAAMAKYEEAERYYKLAEFETDLALYRESYLLSGEPELLFNIGQCNRQLLRYEEALKSYKAYLRDVPNSPSRENIERLINEVEGKLGPQSPPRSAPASTSATQSTSTPAAMKPTDPSEPKAFRGLILKTGALMSGTGLVLGGVSLLGAKRTNEAPPDDLLLFTKRQQNFLALAGVSDVLVLTGVACVGVGFILRQVSKPKPNATLQLNSTSAKIALSLEF